MKSRLARPMPCSPDSWPPSASVGRRTARRARRRCARLMPASAGSNSRLTCRLPLPAWPKQTMRSACRAAIAATRVDQLGDARHRHHHVLVDLARRDACAAPATAPCAPPTAAPSSPASRGALRRPGSLRRARPRASAAQRVRRAPPASPSASIISSAPASGSRAPPRSRARRTQSASMNSSIEGVTGCAMIRATARAAAADVAIQRAQAARAPAPAA